MRKNLLSLNCTALLCALAAAAAPSSLPEPRMSYLDNGHVRIGMDLALGGAVTFISTKDHPNNIINSADLGRQIQMSHYSGPWPFVVDDKKPSPAWAALGWNPIQTGDCFMNPSKVVAHQNDGKELYIKCIPMQWPHNNLPADCTFETWTSLDGPLILMRFRCSNQRADKTAYRPCPQELPAVYTISKLSRLMSYTGELPFTGDSLSHVTNDWKKPWPWTRFIASERWAALVDTNHWGLGVFKDDGGEFHGGIHGHGPSDDPKHSSTAYVAPIHTEIFDHNIVYDHRTVFMVGHLHAIRQRFNSMATRTPPAWRFSHDRQHWILLDATDQGFPLNGQWQITVGSKQPRIESPVHCWTAVSAPSIRLVISYKGHPATARVFWKRLDHDSFSEKLSMVFQLIPDGRYHSYTLNLADSPEYRGLITRLALVPIDTPRPGEQISIKTIALSPPEK
jgi:hypothetical protein